MPIMLTTSRKSVTLEKILFTIFSLLSPSPALLHFALYTQPEAA
jgi:hypothetical protein